MLYGSYSREKSNALFQCWAPPLNADGLPAAFVLDGEKKKFPQDNCRYEDERVAVACCGYALNGAAFTKDYAKDSLAEAVAAFQGGAEKLVRRLKGAYCIAVFDKRENKLLLVNDLLSKQEVYYYTDGTDFLFSTSFFALVSAVRRLGNQLTVDPMGLAMMCRLDAFYEDNTFVNEIKFLRPFRYLTFDGTLAEHTLPIPVTDPDTNLDEAIERADALLSEAVRLQYDKNRENGYRQLASLSGGMDSRNIIVRAYQLGYENDLTFTYSQSGSLDQTISQRIAADYGCPHLFYSMDNGNFLMDRDAYTAENEGSAVYCGSTGVLPLLASLDLEHYGIIHSGISGGEIQGDIVPANGDTKESFVHLDALMTKLSCPSKTHVQHLDEQAHFYETFGIFNQLNDLRTCPNFKRSTQKLADVASPYLDEDYFTFMMTVPMRLRGFRKFYYAWMSRHLKTPYPSTDASYPLFTGTMPERYARVLARRFQQSVTKKTRYDMNPYDYWFATNHKLAAFIKDTFASDMEKLTSLSETERAYLNDAFAGASNRHPFSVLTATWALDKILNG